VTRDIAVIHGLMSSRGHATPQRRVDAAFPGIGDAAPVAEENHVEQPALGDPRDILEQADIGVMAANP